MEMPGFNLNGVAPVTLAQMKVVQGAFSIGEIELEYGLPELPAWPPTSQQQLRSHGRGRCAHLIKQLWQQSYRRKMEQ